MSKLTFQAFVELFKQDLQQAESWIQTTEQDLSGFLDTAKKVAILQGEYVYKPFRLGDEGDAWRDSVQRTITKHDIIKILAEHSKQTLWSHCDGLESYLALDFPVTRVLYQYQPAAILSFINNFDDVKALFKPELVPSELFKDNPSVFTSHIKTFEQLLTLVSINKSNAETLVKKSVSYYAELVTTAAQLKQLAQTNQDITTEVIQTDPEKFADMLVDVDSVLFFAGLGYQFRDRWLQPAAPHLATLTWTPVSFIQLARSAPKLAIAIHQAEPIHTLGLLDAGMSLKALNDASDELAIKVAKAAPEKCFDTISSMKDFLQLSKFSFSTCKLIKALVIGAPARVLALVKTPEEFIKLAKFDGDIAKETYELGKAQISTLFNTKKALRDLEDRDKTLHAEVVRYRQAHGLRLAPTLPAMTLTAESIDAFRWAEFDSEFGGASSSQFTSTFHWPIDEGGSSTAPTVSDDGQSPLMNVLVLAITALWHCACFLFNLLVSIVSYMLSPGQDVQPPVTGAFSM